METKTIHKQIDDYLETLGKLSQELEGLRAEAEKEIHKIREKYAEDINLCNETISELEKDLKALAKKNKGALFGGKNKVKLKHGIMLYVKEDKVTIPRDAVEKIEGLGWKEGIKTIKNIDRPVIEKWPDEKLAAIGAKKKPKEVFSWEIFASSLRKKREAKAQGAELKAQGE